MKFISEAAAQLFCKEGVLENLAKFTGKHLFQSLLFNKVAGPKPAALLKKDTLSQVFSLEFCEIFKNTFLAEHLRWLLQLSIIYLKQTNYSGGLMWLIFKKPNSS